MSLTELLKHGVIIEELAASDRDSVIRELSVALAEKGTIANADDITRQVIEREQVASTAIGGGIAIPHALNPDLSRSSMALGRSKGLQFGNGGSESTRLVFLLVGSNSDPATHLQTLAKLSELAGNAEVVEKLATAPSEDVVGILESFESDLG